MSPLTSLRAACIQNIPITFSKDGQHTDSIKEASHVVIGGETFPLDATTEFYNEDVAQSLRAVVFCWIHDKSSIVDYRSECLENGIQDFKFLVKTELSTWLNGKSDTCEFIKDPAGSDSSKVDSTGAAGVSTTVAGESQATTSNGVDSSIVNGSKTAAAPEAGVPSSASGAPIKRKYEVESIDHNAALRGTKNIDFGYLISDAKRLITQLKKSKSASGAASRSSLTSGNRPAAGSHAATSQANLKQPIIIISPASTSLITLANIKEFLENGTFVDPNELSNRKPSSGIITLNHKSENLQSIGQQIVVVDNVNIFTKPEYWDRVVAIFTTGQIWQFAKYKYSKPEELFQKYPGFFVSYSGDVTPKQIKDWNLNEIKVDRGQKRFRDKMIVRDFWLHMEKTLIAKGYGK
ncbi:cell division control protein 73 [[Candida] railenensis]|uniref:Cell division control protein 73 n=1 Tax=[Candida] railenensis TaxID=45579 RepID=A0A9P0QNW7_9ASCO|nr:cell division control protein 73 [[Candida] railenensis]